MKRELSYARQVCAFLRSEGHRPQCKPGGEGRFATILFRARGNSFFVRVDEQDQMFITVATCLNIPPDICEFDLRRFCATVEDHVKCVKLSLDLESRAITVGVEHFLESPARFSGPFWRYVSAVETGASELNVLLACYDTSVSGAAQRFIEGMSEELARGDK